jgi:hypothetical protein
MRAHGKDGNGKRAFHKPMHDVDPMREQVRERSTAEVPVAAPVEVACRVHGLIRRGAKKRLPVELGGVQIRVVPVPLGVILIPMGLNKSDLPEHSGVEKQRFRFGDVRPTSLLHANLQDLFRGGKSAPELLAFLQLVRFTGFST